MDKFCDQIIENLNEIEVTEAINVNEKIISILLKIY